MLTINEFLTVYRQGPLASRGLRNQVKRANLRSRLSVLKSLSLFCPFKRRFDLLFLKFMCRGRHGSVAGQAKGLER